MNEVEKTVLQNSTVSNRICIGGINAQCNHAFIVCELTALTAATFKSSETPESPSVMSELLCVYQEVKHKFDTQDLTEALECPLPISLAKAKP